MQTRAAASLQLQGGVREPAVVHWPGTIAAGSTPAVRRLKKHRERESVCVCVCACVCVCVCVWECVTAHSLTHSHSHTHTHTHTQTHTHTHTHTHTLSLSLSLSLSLLLTRHVPLIRLAQLTTFCLQLLRLLGLTFLQVRAHVVCATLYLLLNKLDAGILLLIVCLFAPCVLASAAGTADRVYDGRDLSRVLFNASAPSPHECIFIYKGTTGLMCPPTRPNCTGLWAVRCGAYKLQYVKKSPWKPCMRVH